MKVTIRDIAKAANVSPSTVSRVLSNSPKISQATKEKVYKVMKELNYEPNIIARSLANSSTKILGLIFSNTEDDLFENPFFIQAMKGISVYAQKRGYYIIYTFSENEEKQLEYIKHYVRSRLVDGIILLTSMENDKRISYLKNVKHPFVLIGRPQDAEGVLWVDNDNFQAMYNVVDYLIKKGRKCIAFIGGPTNLYVTHDRFDGYRKALKTHDIAENEKLIKFTTQFSRQCGYEAMKDILSVEVPSAVITTDDLLAFGVINALHENNIKNVAVVGFNNTPLAEYQDPPLTSVDINAQELGKYAAKLLIDRLEKKDNPHTHYIIDTKLVERASTTSV